LEKMEIGARYGEEKFKSGHIREGLAVKFT